MKTAESPSATPIESTASPAAIQRLPAGAEPIDFQRDRTERPETWDHALTATFEIEQGGRPDLFLVADTADIPHNCSLASNSDGTHSGWCSCQQFEKAQNCRHLCAIRQRAVVDQVSIPDLV